MFGFVLFWAAMYVWFTYGRSIAYFFYSLTPQPYAATVYNNTIYAYIVFIFLIAIIFESGEEQKGKRWSDAILHSEPVRFLIGMTAEAALFVFNVLALYLAALTAAGGSKPFLAFGVIVAALYGHSTAKLVIGRGTRPLRRIFATRFHGLGGSARIAGMLDEWAHPWKPGQILLGRSMHNPWTLIGITDDRHVCTIATNRAGKGRSAIIPNLLTWPGSALVIDPKGQNASVTALARGMGGKGLSKPLGQTVRILDPLGEITDAEVRKLVVRFNPLIELNALAPDYAERVYNIADALVVPNANGKDDFFDNAARGLIAGLVDYVRMSAKVPKEDRNLATVRGLLVHPDGPPIDDMLDMGGLAQSGAAGLKSGGENSTADVIFTAITHTNWLDSVGMQNALSASDFSLKDLNGGNTTVYLVIPPQYLDVHGRFLRLFVNLSLQAATEGRKGKHATLFLLDEFYALGRLGQLAKGAGVLAGYGVKLWPIIQNVGQVKELYPDNWETFLGNAGLWTVFAMNDQTTMEYIAYKLGKRILWRKMRGPKGYEWELAGAASLRDAIELGKTTSRESKKLIVFTESGDVYLLRRAAYDKVFPKSKYSPDPYERRGWSFMPFKGRGKRQSREQSRRSKRV